jgi:hypothetical protein
LAPVSDVSAPSPLSQPRRTRGRASFSYSPVVLSDGIGFVGTPESAGHSAPVPLSERVQSPMPTLFDGSAGLGVTTDMESCRLGASVLANGSSLSPPPCRHRGLEGIPVDLMASSASYGVANSTLTVGPQLARGSSSSVPVSVLHTPLGRPSVLGAPSREDVRRREIHLGKRPVDGMSPFHGMSAVCGLS